MDRAKEQARLKADSEFTRLLADERSKIAPRVDAEVAAEHTKFIAERRKTLVAQLTHSLLEAEKEFMSSGRQQARLRPGRIGTTGEESSRLDNRKASSSSDHSPRPFLKYHFKQTASRKRAYSPSEIAVKTPIPPGRIPPRLKQSPQ
jgi:hypothetical protein